MSEEEGEGPESFLALAAASASRIPLRALTALLDDVLERETGVPLTSLSDSGMGSRETNSLDSNWTTT